MSYGWTQLRGEQDTGALSKNYNDSRVCTLLFDVSPFDLEEPLSAFQHSVFEYDSLFNLLDGWNKLLMEPLKPIPQKTFNTMFERGWPHLNNALKHVPKPERMEDPRDEMISQLKNAIEYIQGSHKQEQNLAINAITKVRI